MSFGDSPALEPIYELAAGGERLPELGEYVDELQMDADPWNKGNKRWW